MPIDSTLQRLSPGVLIELFRLEPPDGVLGPTVRFHNFVGANGQPVVFQGYTYAPVPIEATGFEVAANTRLPRPRLTVANLDGSLTTLIGENEDLVGWRFTRKRTMAEYLDGAPQADPLAETEEDAYFVERKVEETRYAVTWELATAADVENARIPGRQVGLFCRWKYEGEGCRWNRLDHPTLWFDEKGTMVFLSTADACGHLYRDCKLRHGAIAARTLPFGGFPGAGRILR